MRSKTLNEVGKLINEKVIEQFIEQGHRLTGDFEASMELVIGVNGIECKALNYGNYVNLGVKASEIKYPFAKARIDGLTSFVKLRNMTSDDDEAKSIACAIAYKHSVEGMPTENSKQFSRTGKRTEFIDTVFTADMDEIIMEKVSEEFLIDTNKINVTSR